MTPPESYITALYWFALGALVTSALLPVLAIGLIALAGVV